MHPILSLQDSITSIIDNNQNLFKQKESDMNWQVYDKVYAAIAELLKKGGDCEIILKEIKRIKDNIIESVL